MDSVARNPEKAPNVFVVVFWSDKCRDWDGWVIVASGNILRIDLTAIAKERGEPRISERPLIVLPAAAYLTSVIKACQAISDASLKRRGA